MASLKTRVAYEMASIEARVESIMPDVSPVTIQADHTGTVLSGQLPRNIAVTRYDGSTNVTTASAWSASTISGGATYTIGAATGIINLTALATGSVIEATSIYGGISRSRKITVVKNIADPPPSSSTSSAYDSSITETSSTSYGAANAGILTLTCGASGEVDLSAPLTMTTFDAGAHNAAGKWQYSAAGAGVWSDVDTEIESDVAASDVTEGYIAVTQTQTGLTPASDYDFQLLLRNLGSTDTVYYAGTATATTS